MKINALVVLPFLALAHEASAFTCYSGGMEWGSAKLEANVIIDGWCDSLGRRFFNNDQQIKSCRKWNNGKALMVRMKWNGGGNVVLEPSICKGQLRAILNSCSRGGYDDSTNGWRPRLDPGDGCDSGYNPI